METKLSTEVNKVLASFSVYWEEGELIKDKVIEDIRGYQADIITELLNNELISNTYSIQVGDNTIFKIEDFLSMLRYKSYWENNYTSYRNEVGLTSEGQYLNYNTDVVLDFPYKDSVLEGGMTKEDVDRDEVYYHNVLAKEEIDTLLSPKVLSNVKRYDAEGIHDITEFNDNDNLILKGNNLIALSTLKQRYSGGVQAIFIDPPYYFYNNKRDDAFKYNSNFKLSTWLTFMKNRIEIARELLSDDGIISITIGVDGYAHLKVLLDQIFEVNKTPKNYIGTITWRKTDNQSNIGDFANVIDYILLYRKNPGIKLNRLPLTEKAINEYSYNDNIGKYRRSNILDMTRGRYKYDVTTPNGSLIKGPWMIEENEYKMLLSEDRIHWPKSGKQIPYGKTYLKEALEKGQITSDFWDSSYGTNQRSANEIKDLFDDRVFSFAKPELMIMNLISLISKPNDIVMDFFMGSATTQAVAHKMNRQYIGVEQMDYINTISVPRLQKVIDGEDGGISEEVDWQGGGSFVYAELHDLNNEYINRICKIENDDQFDELLVELMDTPYLNFKTDFEKLKNKGEEFNSLTLEQKKGILIESLDLNQLYLGYSEIEDTQYNINEETQNFNHSFYNKGMIENE